MLLRRAAERPRIVALLEENTLITQGRSRWRAEEYLASSVGSCARLQSTHRSQVTAQMGTEGFHGERRVEPHNTRSYCTLTCLTKSYRSYAPALSLSLSLSISPLAAPPCRSCRSACRRSRSRIKDRARGLPSSKDNDRLCQLSLCERHTCEYRWSHRRQFENSRCER